MRCLLSVMLLVVVTLAVGGCRTTAPEQGAGPFAVKQDRLCPGYILTIDIEENPPVEPSSRRFETTIQPDGTVALVSNKVFRAAGKRVGEFRREVRSYYVPKHLKRVAIWSLDMFDDACYFVSGEIKYPGLILPGGGGPTPLWRAIASTGGFTPAANKRKVQVIRVDGERLIVDYTDAPHDSEHGVMVFRGDHVFVPRSSKWLFW